MSRSEKMRPSSITPGLGNLRIVKAEGNIGSADLEILQACRRVFHSRLPGLPNFSGPAEARADRLQLRLLVTKNYLQIQWKKIALIPSPNKIEKRQSSVMFYQNAIDYTSNAQCLVAFVQEGN